MTDPRGHSARSAENLWFLNSGADSDDYTNSYVNGEVEYRYRLPATRCVQCSRPMATANVLPFSCPEPLRREKLLRRSPVSREAYDRVRERVAGHLAPQQREYLEPGAAFMPGLLDVPSTPEADFLWADLGGPLVSRRVQDILSTVCGDDIYFTEIVYRKVGKGSAKARPPVPQSGEPEDIMRAVTLRASLSELPSYARLNVRHQSGLPADAREAPLCPGCGRPQHPARSERPDMTLEMWRGQQLLYLATTLHIVVTDAVRQALEDAGASNVGFTRT